VRKISPPTGIRSPDRPARSQSLYRLSYPVHCVFDLTRVFSSQGQPADKKIPTLVKAKAVLLSKQWYMQLANMFMP
jgi:hypothetical protein